MLLSVLRGDDTVKEIILINNTCIVDDKLKTIIRTFEDCVTVVTPERTLYVNPAWNYGVYEAKYEYVAILNDDIVIPAGFVTSVLDLIDEEDGLFGMKGSSVDDTKYIDSEVLTIPNLNSIRKVKSKVRNYLWGIAIFGKKEDFKLIPYKYKIWCGDDYYHKHCEKQVYAIDCKDKIRHLHSMTTLSNKDFAKIKHNDLRIWKEDNVELQAK
jgi:hypothetical protein